MQLRKTSDGTLTRFQQLDIGCEILRKESQAIDQLAGQLDGDFCQAVEAIFRCRGAVVVTGMGKAGLVGRKISATLASTGTRSHFLHPAEALHGDLGQIAEEDVVLVLSHSGETEEVLRLLPAIESQTIIAITGKPVSSLARAAHITLCIGKVEEAGALRLAPTTSTTTMLALGDALALVVCQHRNFQANDFAKLHPAGSLGRKLAVVDEIMRPAEQCRIACDSSTIRDVLVSRAKTGRRTGAVLLTDKCGRLSGIFTDSDLARLFESKRDHLLDEPIRDVMTQTPQIVQSGERMATAIELLIQKKISELPVVDAQHRPIGVIDITDVVAFLPNGASEHLASDADRSTIRKEERATIMNHQAKTA